MSKSTAGVNEALNKNKVKSKVGELGNENDVIKNEAIEEGNPEALEHLSYVELEKKLTESEEKANDHWNQVLRAQAELENVMRRAEKDVANAHKFGTEKLIAELLPVVDSLERGIGQELGDNEALVTMQQGIELTYHMLLKVLEKFGVQQVDPLGKAFNPDLHEAISTQADANVESNTVLMVAQKGYTLSGRIVRPALVIVAK